MKILFLFIQYPEDKNNSNLTKDLSDTFANKGEDVYVATIREKKMTLNTEVSFENNVNVLRVKSGNLFNNISKVEKVISMMRMNSILLKEITSYWHDIKFDLIIGTTPYMANEKLIWGLKKFYRCPSFLILWDLFPQNAKDLGLIKNRFIFNFFKRKEIKNLKSFDYIGCMSNGNLNYVKEHYSFLKEEQLYLFPLWQKKKEEKKINRDEIRKKFLFDNDDFIFIFGGNMGKPQALENIIFLADKIRDKAHIKFLFVGQGTEVLMLKAMILELGLKNIFFESYLSRENYENLTASCDVGIVSLNEKFTVPNFPSKTMDYLKLGLPVFAVLDKVSYSDYGNLLENYLEAGVVCTPNDLNCCSEKLIRLFEDKNFYDFLSKNGKEKSLTYFNIENNYKIIKKVLNK